MDLLRKPSILRPLLFALLLVAVFAGGTLYGNWQAAESAAPTCRFCDHPVLTGTGETWAEHADCTEQYELITTDGQTEEEPPEMLAAAQTHPDAAGG